MKKKLLWIVCTVLVVALVATLIGPTIILNIVRQETPAQTYAYCDSFYNSYDEVRTHLQDLTAELGTQISSYAIDEADGLYIDSFYLPGEEKTNLIVLTTGVHGMEGYIGATMLDVFFEEIYPAMVPAIIW